MKITDLKREAQQNLQVFSYVLRIMFPVSYTPQSSMFILENNLKVKLQQQSDRTLISCNINGRTQEVRLEIANVHISNICTTTVSRALELLAQEQGYVSVEESGSDRQNIVKCLPTTSAKPDLSADSYSIVNFEMW